MQLNDAVDDFIRLLKFEKRYSSHTVEAYETDLRQFSEYLAKDFEGITAPAEIGHHHIRSWLADIKESNKDVQTTTLNRKISTLGSFFKHALREGMVATNPVRMLHGLKNPARLPVSLQESETSTLLEELSFGEGFKGLTDRMICELLYSTGMRRQELIGLRETDVNWGMRLLRVLGKGNKERMIPLSKALTDSLRDYLEAKRALPQGADREFLLVRPGGKPLYPAYVYNTVRRYLSQVTTQKKRSPHVLRHTFATQLMNKGANIQAIKDLLGHSSLKTTQIYAHTDIERLKAVHKSSHPRENGGA